MITDPKTGKRKDRQRKTTRVVKTLKETKALIGKNNAEKRCRKITGATEKVYIENVINDYKVAYYDSNKHWSESYKAQKNSQHKHFINYFGNKDLNRIDTANIEDYFRYCQEDLKLSANTIQNHKMHLIDLWRFMKKNYSKYGINKRLKKAGQEPLPSIRLHDLRNTFVSVLLNSGKVNPLQVYGCAGHVVAEIPAQKFTGTIRATGRKLLISRTKI